MYLYSLHVSLEYSGHLWHCSIEFKKIQNVNFQVVLHQDPKTCWTEVTRHKNYSLSLQTRQLILLDVLVELGNILLVWKSARKKFHCSVWSRAPALVLSRLNNEASMEESEWACEREREREEQILEIEVEKAREAVKGSQPPVSH